MKKIHKKAQIEVSFNWIFVLIAGAAILAFFLMIIRSETNSSKENIDRAVSGRLDSLLSILQQNSNAQNIEQVLDVEIEFHCEQDGHTYNVKGGKSRTYLDSKIIFTPEVLGSAKTMALTKLYSTPYPVVEILYFTDEKTQYIFLNDGLAKEYYNKMPEVIERKMMSATELEVLEDAGFRKYIIVVNYDVPELRNSMKQKSTIIKLQQIPDNSPFSGKIEFINPLNSSSVPVIRSSINDETLIGAIISGSPELYGCTMEKLMQVSRIVGEINLNRTNLLKNNDVQRCQAFYQIDVPQEYLQSIIGNSTYSIDKNYVELQTSTIGLANINREISRANCPTIY
ncbi:MAG: hypothetical protein WC758_03115 [Candidatus Woesearchaeota archaeon]|jgi:hypothetical protein